MKHFKYMLILMLVLASSGQLAVAGPYSDGISDGIAYNDPDILGWATDCTGTRTSYAGYPGFGVWSDAVGPAPGTLNDVVSLGNGGSATLTFGIVISDGPGADLAVFENAQAIGSNVFAELGFVEVSSNGTDFARFPSRSLTSASLGAFASLDPTEVHNLAGKHVNNTTAWLGTPFDLADLIADPQVQSGAVNLSNITYVRIIDIIGDGLALDSQGDPIYDPYPTNFVFSDPDLGDFETGGFDLDAVAILNTSEPTTGDFDEDGDVDGVDFGIWQAGYPIAGDASLSDGDADGDGDVDGVDFGIWQTNYPTAAPVAGPTAIPEPATLGLLLIGGLAMLRRWS